MLATSISLVTILAFAVVDEPVYSGPQPGEKLTPFKVFMYSGPQAGKEIELAKTNRDSRTVLVFIHEITRPAFQLIRLVDYYGAQLSETGVETYLVWLTADKSQTEEFLTRAKNSLRLKSPVAISLDGLEGPGNYGLNRKVTLTIVVARGDRVTANFAIVQPNETDAPKVLKAMAELASRPAPSVVALRAEMGSRRAMRTGDTAALNREIRRLRQQVDRLTRAVNELQARVDRLEGKKPAQPSSPGQPSRAKKERLPGRTPSDPKLIGMMRRMIRPGNDISTVQKIAEEMTRWAGDDAARKQELAQFCKRILAVGYGSTAAKKVLKQLAGDDQK